ncbi:MAG TPA: hypothetical protein VHZ25_10765, partial [Acidobacteriaceae bacterium]|nr:hypothetical protein [Acidobacteriaceae bacterium]
MERAYRNLGFILLALLPIFIAGFWVPYFSEIPKFDASITFAVHIHALLLFCFLVLLIVQPLAIRYKAFAIHRNLGKLSNVLMPFISVSSAAMLWREYGEHLASGATAAAARNDEFLSAVQLLLLGTVYFLSISSIRKRNVSAHMRYMICIALILLPAGLARTLGYWFNYRHPCKSLSTEKHESSVRAVESALLVRSGSIAAHVCLSAVGSCTLQ